MGADKPKVQQLEAEVDGLRNRVAEPGSAPDETSVTSLEVFQRMVEAMGTAFLMTRGDKFSYANQVCADITGYSVKELIGMPFLNVVHPDHRQKAADIHMARHRGHDGAKKRP